MFVTGFTRRRRRRRRRTRTMGWLAGLMDGVCRCLTWLALAPARARAYEMVWFYGACVTVPILVSILVFWTEKLTHKGHQRYLPAATLH